MRIAILGWGSLIWDLENLSPHVSGDWHMSGGPLLPMEFSRVSAKRKMGLVVCLDPDVGKDCPTHVIRSSRRKLDDAISDLAIRERSPIDRIGAVGDSFRRGRMPEVIDRVIAWCLETGWDAAIWTDLEPNFLDHTGQEFSLRAGFSYLQTLTGDSLTEAHRYITNAPVQTRTPMRRFLETDPWWQSLSRSNP